MVPMAGITFADRTTLMPGSDSAGSCALWVLGLDMGTCADMGA